MTKGISHLSGRERIPFWGHPIPVPISAHLDPATHAGAMVYGADGVIYYSDGVEWTPPVDLPAIQRPYALTPITAVQQTQLRLSPFYSASGETQTGIIFEVSLSPTFDTVMFQRVVDSVDSNLYQITPSDGLDNGQTFYWRGRYLGTNNAESRNSLVAEQVYASNVQRPTILTGDGELITDFVLSDFETGFDFVYTTTQIEIYDNADGSGAPIAFLTSTDGATVAVPDIEDDGNFWYRARYIGFDVAVPEYAYSEWSEIKAYTQAPRTTLITIDTTLSAGLEYGLRLWDCDGTEVDWGDGNSDVLTGDDEQIATHTYATDGVYEITIKGPMDRLAVYRSGLHETDSTKVTRCDGIGYAHGLTTLNGAFRNAENLVHVPGKIPPGIDSFDYCFRECTSLNSIGFETWDVSDAETLKYMFLNCSAFNRNIGSWNVGKVTDFIGMFQNCTAFNQPIGSWNVGSGTQFGLMFRNAVDFDQPIGGWNMSKAKGLNQMFDGATSFNQDIGAWDVSQVTAFAAMFRDADAFDNGGSPSIDNWRPSNANNFSDMFRNSPFNQPIGNWTTGTAINFSTMFRGATAFNQNIGSWDVSAATNMQGMFQETDAFNNGDSPDIDNWRMPLCTDMSFMFNEATAFNQPIGNWDVGAVTDMEGMFNDAIAFNQNIGAWDVSKVTTFRSLFDGATAFNNGGSPDIGNWNTAALADIEYAFLDAANFNQPLGSTAPNGIGWDVSGVGPGNKNRSTFKGAAAFNQNIGSWDISNFSQLFEFFMNATAFNNGGSPDIQNWDTANCTSFSKTFYGAAAFNQPITNWSCASLLSTSTMFWDAEAFNQDVSHLDLSNCVTISSMFSGATVFNNGGQPGLENWTFPLVTNLNGLFSYSAFNQDISGWDVSHIEAFDQMLRDTPFDQDISTWQPLSATSMASFMFNNTLSTTNYNALLIAWAALDLPDGINIHFGSSQYSAGAAADARASLIADDSWTITDGGPA